MKAKQLSTNDWPELKFEELKDTIETVQLWMQIVGKIKLAMLPWVNHSWHITLMIYPRGLTTGAIPYPNGIFQIDFDFLEHQLIINTSEGETKSMSLHPRSVADFYVELFDMLKVLDIGIKIHNKPNEVDPAIPFMEDEIHHSYSKEQMHLLWKALVKIDTIFKKFRSRFCGKCSPVHFFWGAFDLAVTRFSGRKAPKHQGGAPNMPNKIMQEAYSHEVSSAGFWPGNEAFPQPSFYAYCYPVPDTFGQQSVRPSAAFFSKEMGEFLLPYDAIRNAANPEKDLMDFLQSTYEAAAITGNWDKNALAFSTF